MKTELKEIQYTLQHMLRKHVPPLQVRKDTDSVLEMAGTKEAMQGKQLVDGFYFGSIVPKPKDIRLYFFPIYTHPKEFSLSPELQKCLKGKSCFHIKALSQEMEEEIDRMIKKGVACYLHDDLI